MAATASIQSIESSMSRLSLKPGDVFRMKESRLLQFVVIELHPDIKINGVDRIFYVGLNSSCTIYACDQIDREVVYLGRIKFNL